jgi:hypothetical protein
MTVSVGLGTGNREQAQMNLLRILDMQSRLMAIGIVKPENVHHAFKKYIQAAGFKDDESFISDPQQQQPQPPNPELVIKQQELALKDKEISGKQQIEQQRLQLEAFDRQLKAREMDVPQDNSDTAIKAKQLQLQEQEMMLNHANERDRIALDAREQDLKAQQIGLQAEEARIKLGQNHQKMVGDAIRMAAGMIQKAESDYNKVSQAKDTADTEKRLSGALSNVSQGLALVQQAIHSTHGQIGELANGVKSGLEGLAGEVRKPKKSPKEFRLEKNKGKTVGIGVKFDDGSEDRMPVT